MEAVFNEHMDVARRLRFQTAEELSLNVKKICETTGTCCIIDALLRRTCRLKKKSSLHQLRESPTPTPTAQAFWSQVGALFCLIENRPLVDLAGLSIEGSRRREDIKFASALVDILHAMDSSVRRLPLVTLLLFLAHAGFVLKEGPVEYDDELPDTVAPAAACFAAVVREVFGTKSGNDESEIDQIIKDSFVLCSKWNSLFATNLAYDTGKMARLHHANRRALSKPGSLLENCLVNTDFNAGGDSSESWVTVVERLTRHQLEGSFAEASRSFITGQVMSSVIEHDSDDEGKSLAFIDFSSDESIVQHYKCPVLQAVIYRVYADLEEVATVLTRKAQAIKEETKLPAFEQGFTVVFRQLTQALLVISLLLSDHTNLFDRTHTKLMDM